MEGTIKCAANYVPLTPISFLERSAIVYRDRISIVYGDIRFTWQQTSDRCVHQIGISSGDVVAVLAPNIPAMYELHFGVPMAGAVLCTINIRLDSAMVALLLGHSETKIFFVDNQFLPIAQGAYQILSKKMAKLPKLVLILQCDRQVSETNSISTSLEYDRLLAMGKADFEIRRPKDELEPITLNYTFGTTSSPKGVVYSHRGSYLNSLATVLNEMRSMAVYLWAVPMFHCNGWCFPWALAAQGGTNVCLNNVTAKGIFESIAQP